MHEVRLGNLRAINDGDVGVTFEYLYEDPDAGTFWSLLEFEAPSKALDFARRLEQLCLAVAAERRELPTHNED